MRGTAPRLDPVREEPRLPFAVGAYDRRVEQDARAVFLVAEDERLRERVVLGRFGAPQLGQLRILVSQPGQTGRWAQVRHPVGQPIEAVRRVEEGPVVRRERDAQSRFSRAQLVFGRTRLRFDPEPLENLAPISHSVTLG